VDTLSPGMVIDGWALMHEIAPSRLSWEVTCVACGAIQSRPVKHLLSGVPKACGACRSSLSGGRNSRARIATRNGESVDELELWALDNCDDDPAAQLIVDGIIRRETQRIRETNAKAHAVELAKELWRYYNSSRNSDVRQYSAMEGDDDDVESR
jgi:hypothetical protein